MSAHARQRLLAIAVFLAVIAILSRFMGRREVVSYRFVDGGFTVSTASGQSRTIRWDEIEGVELLDSFEAGSPVDAVNEGGERSGTWDSEAYGTVSLYTDASVERWIAISLPDSVTIVNFESEASTGQLYLAIVEATRDADEQQKE